MPDYTLGKGAVSFFIDGGSDFVAMGNCPDFRFSTSRDILEHFSSQSGAQTKDAEVVLQQKATVNFTLDEPNVSNMQYFAMGTLSGTTIVHGLTLTEQKGKIKFTGNVPTGKNWELEGYISLLPDGDMSLVGTDWMQLSFVGEFLDHASYVGQFKLTDVT